MIRLLLIDAYGFFRSSLAANLQENPDVEFVLQADSLEQGYRLIVESRPDIVLLDWDTVSCDIRTIAATIRAIDSTCRLLLLSGHDLDTRIEQALAAEVHAYLLKTDDLDTLVYALRKVRDGGMYFSESVRPRLCVEHGCLQLRHPRCTAIGALTPRERQLLIHLGRGASLKEAAAAMAVSYKTADNQKASLMRKLDIHDRVTLARFAIREGLVSVAC